MKLILLILFIALCIIFCGTILVPQSKKYEEIKAEAKLEENILDNDCQILFDYKDKLYGRTNIYRCVKGDVVCFVATTIHAVSMKCNEVK